MKLQLKDGMTYQSVFEKLKADLPQYRVELKKNPLARFEYVQVRKSAFVGIWVRLFPKKGEVMLMKGIPDFWARFLFGGLIAILFCAKAQKEVANDVADALVKSFNIEKK